MTKWLALIWLHCFMPCVVIYHLVVLALFLLYDYFFSFTHNPILLASLFSTQRYLHPTCHLLPLIAAVITPRQIQAAAGNARYGVLVW